MTATAADDLEELRAALRADVGAVAEALLGPPNKVASSRSTLRWGSKGSLALEVRGPRKGLWFTHEGGEGGDPLGLIRFGLGCDFPAAVAWARDWTGVADSERPDERLRPRRSLEQEAAAAREQAGVEAKAGEDADEARRVHDAQQMARASAPVAGTPGEFYLHGTRRIPSSAAGWPDAVRWHAGYNALLFVGTALDGSVRAVQRVHINEWGEKLDPEEVQARGLRAAKVTNGVLDGVAVRLPGDPAGPLLLAEGPETGLSGFVATGHETWIALGGVGKMTPPAGRLVVVLRDDDPRFSPADKRLRDALTRWRRMGCEVVVATPWATRRGDRSDFNDTIQAGGPDAVRARIERVLVSGGQAAARRLHIAEARRAKDAAIERFFAEATAWQPPDEGEEPQPWPVHGVKIDVGVGKSDAARREAARMLVALRARKDKRTVILAVPMHKLADEQAADFMQLPEVRAAGFTAAVWRGRERPDPHVEDELMCRNMDAVDDARQAGCSSMETAVCRLPPRQGRAAEECPFFNVCGYQRQRRARADLWIVPHSLLFQRKPAAIGTIAAVVVDEAAWKAGLEGVEGRPILLLLDTLDGGETIRFADTGTVDQIATDRLHYLRHRLLDVLREMPDGPVHRAPLLTTVLDADNSAEALKLEWRRKVEPGIRPSSTSAERKAAIKAAEANGTLRRMTTMWDAVRALLAHDGPEASGRLELARDKKEAVRALRLKGRRDLGEGWAAVPTLLLDATLRPDLARVFWPRLEVTATVLAEAPHQHIFQVVDRAYSKSALDQLAEGDPDAQRRARNLRNLRAVLVREAHHVAPGRVLVVLQKGVREALAALGPLPSNILLAHHNAVAGRDEWRDVCLLVAVGRTMPSPHAVEKTVEALTGAAVANPATWYDRADALREMRDGSTTPAEADRHPHPLAELVRAHIVEDQLLQVIGRARGVNRTAANPVAVLLLTDVPLPIPLAGVLTAADLTPSAEDLMLAEGGIAFENAGHAAVAYPYPSLWPSHTAATKALLKPRTLPLPYRKVLIGEGQTPQLVPTELVRVEYQVAGRGSKATAAWCDRARVPDPAALLAAVLGPLAWLRMADISAPAEPPAPPSPEPSADMRVSGARPIKHPPAPHPMSKRPEAPEVPPGAWSGPGAMAGRPPGVGPPPPP